MTIPKVFIEMRPINLLSSNVSLPDAEAEFLGVSRVYYVDFAMAIGTTMVIMAIVAVLDIVALLIVVTVS